jgi:hypothetical protein
MAASVNAIKRVAERTLLLTQQITRAQVRVQNWMPRATTVFQEPISSIAAGRLAHQPLNSTEIQPYPSDHRDRNHAKIESLE